MFQTVRFKLLALLLSFVLITIVTLILSFDYTARSKEKVSEIKQNMHKTNILLFEDVNVIRDFFAYETINSRFFETGKSKFLDRHYILCRKIESSLSQLETDQREFNYDLDKNISNIKEGFQSYKKLTNNIIKQILIKGFKDHGIEGKMRNSAHLLEEYNQEIGLENVLALRRHEKDFIIRQDDQYIIKFDNLFSQINVNLKNSKNITHNRKLRIKYLLDNYYYEFNRLTKYEKLIGLKNQKGLKGEIDKTRVLLAVNFAGMIELASEKERNKLAQISLLFILIGIVFIVLCSVAAVIISKKASQSIIDLKDSISDFIKSDFTKRTSFPMKDSFYEVDQLTNSFNIMEQQIVSQVSKLKETNRELEQLLYRSSHDIKGPLSTIKGITNLANEEVHHKEALLYFSMIESAGDKLYKIVDELSVVKNIKSEKIKKERIKFDELVRSVIQEFRFLSNFDTIIFSVEINLDMEFVSDEGLVKTIFRKLIENSIMYSKQEKSMNFVRVSISKDTNDMVKIIISDNGIGIKKEFHKKIFEMFFIGTQLSNGPGLGLYLLQNSLQKLNGAISLESEEGKGATFTILLPNVAVKKSVQEYIIQNRKITDLAKGNLVLNYI